MEETKIFEAKAELALANENHRIKTLEEYESLGKPSLSRFSNVIVAIPMLIFLASQFLFELESHENNIVVVMLFAAILIHGLLLAEQKKINRRIELLHKIITYELEQKNT